MRRVGVGANKPNNKDAAEVAKLKKEIKELKAENKQLKEENEQLKAGKPE